MKIHLLLLCLVIFLTSCAVRLKDQVNRYSVAGHCEQAAAVFERNAIQEKVWQKMKQIGGTTASGAMTGAVIVTETTIYTVPGIAVGALVCSPVIALEVAAKSNGRTSVECIKVVGSALMPEGITPLSRKTWEKTQSWRLESYDELSRMLRDVSQCYAERNTPEGLMTAETQLLSIRNSMWDKLSEEEKMHVDSSLKDIDARRKALKGVH